MYDRDTTLDDGTLEIIIYDFQTNIANSNNKGPLFVHIMEAISRRL